MPIYCGTLRLTGASIQREPRNEDEVDTLTNHPIVEKLCNATRFSEVFELMYESCLRIGGNKLSYHFAQPFGNLTGSDTAIHAKGFPPRWVALYNGGALRKIDPIPDTVMKVGRIMSWREAVRQTEVTDEEECLIRQARANGLGQGIGFPLWGPNQRDAYAAIGFSGDDLTDDECLLMVEQMVLQAAHQKICEIIPISEELPTLSKRECEILGWVGRGKSNTDIATILGLSPETIRTYLSRVYTKLGSRDRVGATVRALKLGLIYL